MKKILPFLNAIFFILVLTINYLANYLPLNNVTTGEVSDSFQNLFTPAGFTFAIWGLIYFLLGIYVFYQIGFIGTLQELDYYRNKIGLLFITSCILNVAWLISWHYRMFLISLVIMVALLLNLIFIYLRINAKGNYLRKRNNFVSIPFSVYLGWIMVATIANVSVYLLSINWDGFGFSNVFWTNAVIIIALLIFLTFLLIKKDVYVMAVFIWASLGILYRHIYIFNSEYITIIITISFAVGSALTAVLLSKRSSRI